MVTGYTRTTSWSQQPMISWDTNDETSCNVFGRQFHQPSTPQTTDQYGHLLSRIQTHISGLLQTEVPTFRGKKGTFNEQFSNNSSETTCAQWVTDWLKMQCYSFIKASFKDKQSISTSHSPAPQKWPWVTLYLNSGKNSVRMTWMKYAAADQINGNTISQPKPSPVSSNTWTNWGTVFSGQSQAVYTDISLRQTPDLKTARFNEQ